MLSVSVFVADKVCMLPAHILQVSFALYDSVIHSMTSAKNYDSKT